MWLSVIHGAMKHDRFSCLTHKEGLYQTNHCSVPILKSTLAIQSMSVVFNSSRRRYPEGRTKLACSVFFHFLHPPMPLLLFPSFFFSNSLQVGEPSLSFSPPWPWLTLLPSVFLLPFFLLSLYPRSPPHCLSLLALALKLPSVSATAIGGLIKQYNVGERNYVSTQPVSCWDNYVPEMKGSFYENDVLE